MGRVLAIDPGARRCGLAVTDPLRLIATALDTVDAGALLDHLRRYLHREAVDGFVVGVPRGLDGGPTDGTAPALALVESLRKTFPQCFVEVVDERFTSVLAERTLLASGKGRQARRDKGQLDRISATILLQDWLRRAAR
ncbi:MAG: Holliday junction resolvase RuvX [Flavobacteriales bacterium]|nr:putative pre-16S rRNA nuclease [Flavobacteriales bacterium]MCC6577008.1 Holliday junction resolvase RuvX [Flavobacteriales bacterium]NUQ15364.1 Holliday junction resolvase RuvX [Flavobacteriales bacterium]